MTKTLKISPARLKKILVVLLLLGIVAFNVVAALQAWSMTHFADGGGRTGRAESLKGVGKALVLLKGINVPKPENATTPTDSGLFYETHLVPCTNGIVLEAWHIPHPAPSAMAVLFHGYANAKSSLLNEARAFYDMGCSVFMVDFRGSGGSSEKYTTIGFYEAEDVRDTFAYIGTAMTNRLPIVAYGDSMGAAALFRAIAMGYANPDCIVAEGVFDRLISAVRNRFRLMNVPSFPAAEVMMFWGSVENRFWTFQHNPLDYSDKIRCPTLFLHGAEDPRATLAQVSGVYERVSCRKEMIVFAGLKHESCLNADPAKWRNAVRSLLPVKAAAQSAVEKQSSSAAD